MEYLNCFMCSQFVHGGLNGLAEHFRDNHGLTLTRGMELSGFVCGQNGCDKSYRNFYDLRRHIRNNHAHQVNQNVFFDAHHEHNENNEHGYNNDAIGEELNNMEVPNREDLRPDVQPDNNYEFNLKLYVTKMIGKLHCHGSMTGSLMKTILEECEDLLLYVHDSLKTKISSKLTMGNIIDEHLIQNINDALDFDSPFDGLKNYDQQFDALINTFGYIKSEQIPLGRRIDTVLDSKTCSYIPTTVMESFQYIPIIKVFELILSNNEVRCAIQSEQPSLDGELGSFIDGQHFQNHPFFQTFKHALRIKLYYDELEIVNPIGSKTGVHKLGAFYYQLDNLPHHMNSHLDSIHVLILCSHEDIIKYGFKKILAPFIQDLQKLEADDGITLQFDNEDFILRASLMSFCGDGLAVHEIYNLLGPSANKFCRMCLYSRADLHSVSLETAPERTEEMFNEQLAFLIRANFSDAAKTATGMKGESCLNESRYFHISRNKIFDIMHDFLCGICHVIVKLVLHKYIIVKKKFNCTWLNGAISLFNYGYLENTNKPSANFTDGMLCKREYVLSQKAMQMWTLVRSLPFILSQKIDPDDESFILILHLLRIMEIVFAPKVTKSMLPYLDILIQDFISLFSRLFPDVHLTNKFHHLTHYSKCFEWSGPLLHHYCMRFEGKHGQLRLRAHNVHNFKNPPKTIVRIAQCTQSCKWGARNVKVHEIRKVSAGKHKIIGAVLSRRHLINLGFVETDFVYSLKSVSINGVEFRVSLFVVLETQYTRPDNLLLFGRIEEIILINEKIYLLTSACTTILFDTDVHAYRIEVDSNENLNRFVEISSLKFYKPFCFWTKPGSNSMYISTRHIIL